MKGSAALACLFLALFVRDAALAQRRSDPERDAVRQVLLDFAAHVRVNDLGSLDSLFRRGGLHILTDSTTTHGWTEYRDEHLAPQLARFQNLRYTHSAVEAVVRGDVAWVAFRRELSGSEGSPASVRGRGTAVLERIDGRWVIVHLHMSQ